MKWLAARVWVITHRSGYRSRDSPEYIPEPDIFHDVFGHVPMHAHRVFADFLQHYGSVCVRINGDQELLEQLGRLFWYTVEFGLIRQHGAIKVYGSGVISFARRMYECDSRGAAKSGILSWKRSSGPPCGWTASHSVLFAIESFDELYEGHAHAAEDWAEQRLFAIPAGR